MMPSDYRKIVLIGDALPDRASFLGKIIEEDFKAKVISVRNFDEIKEQVLEAKKQNSRWKLVLIANDLPFSAFIKDSIQPEHFSFVSQMEAVVSLGYVHSETPAPVLRGVNFDPIYLYIPPSPHTSDHRQMIVDSIRAEPRAGLTLAQVLPKIELDVDPILGVEDPILREQIRSLDSGRDLRKSKELLAYLIRDFNSLDCDRFVVSKLIQGASGAAIFRFRPGSNKFKINECVLKLTRRDNIWKLEAEVQKHLMAGNTLGNRYQRHVPDMVPICSGDGSSPEHIASYRGWRAIAYDFLGGEQFSKGNRTFGKFIDLELAFIGSFKELEGKSKGTEFEQHFNNPATLMIGRKHILSILLKWLCESWYLKSARRKQENVLWDYSDGSDDQFTRFPPYQLTARSKRYILSFLDSRQAKMGERFFTDWKTRHQQVREFVAADESDLSNLYSLHDGHPMILSPAHGDLNSNNILLWLDGAHPFLIDFPFYQKDGHALQDFARLEVEIKLILMDRQDDDLFEELRAFDYTHTQMPLWQALEDHLLRGQRRGGLTLPSGAFDGNIRLSYELVGMVRARAKEVQEQQKKKGMLSFWSEYRLPLLYHTLRAIGYDSLSIFKRLLAVRSASQLLEQCRVK